jgi:hypothetical protein
LQRLGTKIAIGAAVETLVGGNQSISGAVGDGAGHSLGF